MTTDEFGGVAVEDAPPLDAETQAKMVRAGMQDEFGGTPVQTDPFGGVPVTDLSGVKVSSAERDALAAGPAGNRESYSITVPPALNPDFDVVKATHGNPILAVPLATAAKAMGSQHPEEAPFKPLVSLPHFNDAELSVLPEWGEKLATAYNALTEDLSSMTTPENVVQLPFAANRGMQLAFLSQMGAHFPDLAQNVAEAKTTPEKITAWTHLLDTAAMAGLLAHGIVGKAKTDRFGGVEIKPEAQPAEEGAVIPEGGVDEFGENPVEESKVQSPQPAVTEEPINETPRRLELEIPKHKGWRPGEAQVFLPTIEKDIQDAGYKAEIVGSTKDPQSGSEKDVDIAVTPESGQNVGILIKRLASKAVAFGKDDDNLFSFIMPDGRKLEIHIRGIKEDLENSETGELPYEDWATKMPATGHLHVFKGEADAAKLTNKAPEKVAEPAPIIPTDRPEEGVPIQTFERPPDILDDIDSHVGGVRVPAEPDFDYVREAFKGLSQSKAGDLSGQKLKSLFKGTAPDEALDALHREGLWRNVQTPDELFQRMIGAARQRVEWAKQEKAAKNFKAEVGKVESGNEEPDWAVAEVGPNDFVGMGGATPSEFETSKGLPTSIKNAAVDAERVKRGLPPAAQVARRSFGDVWDQAGAALDKNPAAADDLIAELRDKPRALTDQEDALLLQHQIFLQNQYSRLTRELAQAYEDAKEFPNRMDAVADLKQRVAKLSDDLLDLYNVNKAAGTETGRGLAARRLMAYEDYSLAKMELDKRAANDGRPLTDEERSQVQRLHEQISATQKAYDDYVAKTEAERAQRQAKEEIDDMVARVEKQPGYDRNVISLADRIVQALEGEAVKARARLKEKFKQVGSGVDPTILGDLAVVGAAKIARGALDFTRWSKEMVADFGEDVVPWLNQAWEKSNAKLDESVSRVAKGKTAIAVKRAVRKEDVTGQRESIIQGIREAKGQPLAELGPYVRKLAENFVRGGIKERDALIDAVHGVLKSEVDPNITRRQAMDAISGYGDFKPLNPETVKVQLRDLKGQMQQVAKLEDIQAKQPLKKSGLERRLPSDEERRLIQQVNEAKRRYGVVSTDPATQLKSALDAIKTRLRNQIKDLQFQIATKEKIVRAKTPTPFDAEAEGLKMDRDKLKEQYDAIFTKPGLTDAERVQNALRSVKASIDDYERRIAAKDIARKTTATPSTPELEAARARRDALRAQFEELRNANEDYQREQAAKGLQQQKTALEQSIRLKEQQLAAGAPEATAQPVNRPADPLIEQLMQRRDALNRQLAEARKKPEAQRYADELAKRLEGLQQRIAERKQQIATGDIQPRPQPMNRPLPPELEMAKQQLEQLNRQLAELRNPTKTPEQRALQSLKTRLVNRTAELQERLAKQDFAPRVRRTIQPDAETLRLKLAMEQAKQAFQRALITDRLKNRPWAQKATDAFLRWRRGFLLSSPVTLAKLTSAAAQRLAFTPIEEAVGGVISKTLPRLAERAPREGGLNVNAEAKSLTEGFMRGLKDSWNQLRNGESEMDVLYGRGREGAIGESDVQPKSIIDFFGHLHAALKAPVKRAEFARSFEKRMAWNMRQGVDVREPGVQTRIAIEAYKDANRSIFLQDNRVVSAYKAALVRLEQPAKGTKQVPIGGKAAATALRTVLPIIRVPTNLVAETFANAFGLVSGSARLALALRKGIETLPPDQADLIMRHLKKGSLGAALMTAGFLLPNMVGGYYQPGQKRDKADVPVGGLRVNGVTVPTYLLHNPLLETLQLGATIRRVADSKLRKKDAETQGIPAGLAAGALGLTAEAPFVREMLETSKAFDPHTRGAFVGELTKSVAVPQLVQWTAQQTDKDAQGDVNKRKPETTVQHIETGIPGLRQNVPLVPLPPNPAVTRFMQSIRGGTPDLRNNVRQAILRSVATNQISTVTGR